MIKGLRCSNCGTEIADLRSFQCHNWAYASATWTPSSPTSPTDPADPPGLRLDRRGGWCGGPGRQSHRRGDLIDLRLIH